ncbi:MAG: S8 family serine peptidase [Chitinophagales bacterium]|nr:S8 family serine peptidase [Chitinophagales bacterium]
MSQLTVKSGNNELKLKKSKSLVGIRTKSTDEKVENKDFVNKELHENMGGFNIVELEKGGKDIDTRLDEVREKDDIEIGTHVYFAEGSNKPLVATGELFITFEDGVSEEEQAIALDEFNLELVERRSPELIVAKVTAKSPNPLKVAHLLQQISMVKVAEPDLDTLLDEYEFISPTDELLSQQWHIRNTGIVPGTNYILRRGADAKIYDAWRRLGSMGSDRVKIAIIDNGFDTNHPDLRTKVYRPYDLWNQSSNISRGNPRFTHGTPCASVALAVSNGRGIVGAAPNAMFIPLSGTSFSNRATEQMFDYCVNNGADIISCSWGTTSSSFRLGSIKEAAIARAARRGRNGKGCIILFAVGNEGLNYVNHYAAHPDVIAVAASTSKDTHASYSNQGREVFICAPSNGDWPILAARASWDQGISWESGVYKYYRDGRDRGRHYKHFGGTSSATPLVAGVVALMLSANPDLTAREVKDILKKTADRIGNSSDYWNGHSRKYGYGRINADKAVAEALRRRDRSTPPVLDNKVEEEVTSGNGLFNIKVETKPTKGWGVQVGVYGNYGNVLVQVEKLEKQFREPVNVNIVESNGRTLYKIIVGAYDNIEDARRLHVRIKAAGISGFIKDLSKL